MKNRWEDKQQYCRCHYGDRKTPIQVLSSCGSYPLDMEHICQTLHLVLTFVHVAGLPVDIMSQQQHVGQMEAPHVSQMQFVLKNPTNLINLIPTSYSYKC